MAEHDPKLVEDLAEVIGGDHWWECDHFNESSEDGCKVDVVRAALDWLTERGRLLPSGGEVEWGWRGWSDQDPQRGMPLRDETAAREGVAEHPGTELVRRQVGPWSPVVSDNSEEEGS